MTSLHPHRSHYSTTRKRESALHRLLTHSALEPRVPALRSTLMTSARHPAVGAATAVGLAEEGASVVVGDINGEPEKWASRRDSPRG
jgi:hypothetical protein